MNAGSHGILLWIATSQEITCKFNSYDSVKKYRLYSGYVLFTAISLIHVWRSDRFKAEPWERIYNRTFRTVSLERLAAASGCISSNIYRNLKSKLLFKFEQWQSPVPTFMLIISRFWSLSTTCQASFAKRVTLTTSMAFKNLVRLTITTNKKINNNQETRTDEGPHQKVKLPVIYQNCY